MVDKTMKQLDINRHVGEPEEIDSELEDSEQLTQQDDDAVLSQSRELIKIEDGHIKLMIGSTTLRADALADLCVRLKLAWNDTNYKTNGERSYYG